MAGLQQFVANVQKMSTDGHLQQLADHLRKAMADVLPRNLQNLDNVLQTLTMQQHSLGILAVLLTKLNHVNDDLEPLLFQIEEFITNCNGEHIREVPSLVADLSHKLTELLIERSSSKRGIPLLLKLLGRLQAKPSQLTPVHADVCQLCLQSKLLKPALEILRVDIDDILAKKENAASDAKSFLLYYYYGGTIFGILKEYSDALSFLEICLCTPAAAVSQIMVEAYKKYMIISLILHGKVAPLPKYHSTLIGRFLRPMCTPYVELEEKYKANQTPALRSHVESARATFEQDNNMGLVKQVEVSLVKRSIQRLTKTFLTLSLVDLANRCHLGSPAEAEAHIRNMIDEGEIFASINERDGMVEFKDNPEDYSSLETLQFIEAKIDEGEIFASINERDGMVEFKDNPEDYSSLETLQFIETKLKEITDIETKTLREKDRQIMLSQEYVRKINKSSGGMPDDEGLGGRDFLVYDAP